MRSLDAVMTARSAAKAVDGLAQHIVGMLDSDEQAAAMQDAMEAMVISDIYEQRARSALSDVGFTLETIDSVISTMRSTLQDKGNSIDDPPVRSAS